MSGEVSRARGLGTPAALLGCSLLALLALGCGALASPASAPMAATIEAPAAVSTAAPVTVTTPTATPTEVPPPPTATPAATPVPTPAPGATVLAQAAARAAVQAPARDSVRVLDRVASERRRIALTFDAGADTGHAALILDTLREHGAAASFGMTGSWAERNPALLRRMAAEGHQLMNHTYDHASFTGVSTRLGAMPPALRRQQLERTEEIVRAIVGVELRPYFRPPYGDYDSSVNADIAASGYRYNVMWSVDSLGWNGLPAGAIVQRCLQRATPGAIIVLHVGAASQDAAALPGIIEGLRRDGYEFATVRQLVEP